MNRSSIAAQPADRSPAREARLFWLLVAGSMLLTIIAILHGDPALPPHPMDQAFANVDLRLLHDHGHWEWHYPHLQWSGGITASLTVGLYKLLVPEGAQTLNWQVRSLGALMYLASASLAIRLFVRDGQARIAAFVLVAASGFQLLEPTSELIAAAYFALFCCAALKRWPAWAAAAALALFGLCKVELLLPALAMLFLLRSEGNWAREAAAWWAVFTAALIAPALILYGTQGAGGGRALDTLSQHYAWVMEGFPLSSDFGRGALQSAGSIAGFVAAAPLAYALFVLKSLLAFTAVNLVFTLKGLLLLALPRWRGSFGSPGPWLPVLASICISFVPALLVAYVHVRYVARYLPVLVTALFWTRESAGRTGWPREWTLPIGLTLALDALSLPLLLLQPHGF